jgi:PBP1b-binding outer membrane lipoprotein LpoB
LELLMRVLLLSLLLTGCATVVPVTARFPAPPGQTYLQACPDLQKLKDQPQLSDVSRTININYSTYYECAVKLDAWIQWYSAQKLIFESAGK